MNLYNDFISPQDKERLAIQLNRLASPEFEVLRRYLKIKIAESLDTLVSTANPVVGYRAQGRVMAIKDLLEAIEAKPSQC